MQLLFLEVGEADGEVTDAGLEGGEDIGVLVSECSEVGRSREVQGGCGGGCEVLGSDKRSQTVRRPHVGPGELASMEVRGV